VHHYLRQRSGALGFGGFVMFVVAITWCTFLAITSLAYAEVIPHVATSADSDTCAMCHRTHTSASGIETAVDGSGTRTNALILGTSSKEGGDAQLCYACHGVDTLGSIYDVEEEFESGPGHSLTPTSSPFGPREKQCSDCHDPHGSAKRSDGTSYPALLRVQTPSGGFVYSGDEYCASCHAPRSGSEFPGLAVWQQTAHATLPPPASGTGIVCSDCHTPHASPIQPNIVSVLSTPVVSAPTTITANDRTFCLACHAEKSGTWDGADSYVASAHGSSVATVPITAEWASSTASRTVGDCQSCHAPMGASDGRGGVIPSLLSASGRQLCYQCHSAGGAASTDLKSLDYTPAPVISLVAGFDSEPGTSQLGAAFLYTRDSTSTATIDNPRQIADTHVGAVAAGDVEGTGENQLVIARAGTSRVSLYSQSAIAGLSLSPGDRTLLAPATWLAIGDVLDDIYSRQELVTADGDTVRVYRWDSVSATFDSIAAKTLPGTITGLAVGKVLGGARSDIVVTTNDPDRLVVLSQDTPTSLGISGSYPTRSLPRSPSVGDIEHNGTAEIAVANAGETNPVLSVYSSTGTEIMSGGSSSDASACATAIGDFLPGSPSDSSADEIALSLNAPQAASKVMVFSRSASGLASPIVDSLETGSGADALAMGDVDGDGRPELLVGLDGLRSSNPVLATPPAVAIVHADSAGTGFGLIDVRSAGGVEFAGQTSVLAADLGAIGPSRHPVEVAEDSHSSTEAAPFAEHVTCSDCHNSHTATAARPPAPGLPGALIGARGVTVGGSEPVLNTNITSDSQLCFKCHASYDGSNPLSGVRTVDEEFSTSNASFHPVEGVSPDTNAIGDTLVGSLTSSSRVNCSDCHGDANGRGNSSTGEPNGPHRSTSAPLLTRPLLGTASQNSDSLCYSCHRYTIYGDGTQDDDTSTSSGFVDRGTDTRLHAYHATRGITCLGCHVSHGSIDEPYDLRSDVGWDAKSGGGSCDNGCHGGSLSYHR
jgi:predicted CXXCH cytochrome family protein